MTLNNKVAVVTGAASGIGEQCARKLAAQGAKVVIADLSLKNAQQVAASINDGGGSAFAVEMNVIDEDAVIRYLDAIGPDTEEDLGPLVAGPGSSLDWSEG